MASVPEMTFPPQAERQPKVIKAAKRRKVMDEVLNTRFRPTNRLYRLIQPFP